MDKRSVFAGIAISCAVVGLALSLFGLWARLYPDEYARMTATRSLPPPPSRDNPLVLIGDAARDGARYRDVETGCEYFLRMTLVVRLDASGKPYCRGGRQ